jgi:hypothetical protein
MVALTWWGWSGLVVSVGVIVWIWGRHAWRAAVRQELVDYLAHAAPDLVVTDVDTVSIVCGTRDGGAAGAAVSLRTFYRDLAAHPGGSAESEAARLAIFAAVADAARARVGDGRAEPLRRAS